MEDLNSKTEPQSQNEETSNRDTSIKLTLPKEYFEFQKQINRCQAQISEIRRKINTAIAKDDDDMLKQYQQEKTNLELEITELENQLGAYLEELLILLLTGDKWIIQFYEDKMDTFIKAKLLEIAKKLNLQINNDNKKILSIARQGRPIKELINITITESKAQNGQSNPQSNNSNPNQATNNNDNSNSGKKERTDENSTNSSTNDKKETQSKNESPSKNAQTDNKMNEGNANPKSNPNPNANTNNKNNNQNKKTNNNNNNSNGNKNNNNKGNNKNNQKQVEEEEVKDNYENGLMQKSYAVQEKERLREIEEEQKTMNEQQIFEFLEQPPDFISGYDIISMSSDYVVRIRVHIPEQNSFPITTYKAILMKQKNTNMEITSEKIKESTNIDIVSLHYDQQIIATSNTNELLIDLKEIYMTNFLQYFNNELSYTLFSLTATSQKQDDEEFTSEIKFIFRLNVPRIIKEKTKLLMSGSCDLINPQFIAKDQFESLYDNKQQAIRNFIQLNDPTYFSNFEIQSINLKQSAMLLQKDGTVIQWGDIICFKDEEKKEFLIEEIEEQTFVAQILEPFMPVQHPLVFTRIAQGESHYVGVTIDGKVYSWGLNDFGQLGHQNYTSYPEPKKIEFFSNEKIFIVDVKCGDNFTVCQSIQGCLYTFGKQQSLEGIPIKDTFNSTINFCNANIHSLIPRLVNITDKITQFECGNSHCVFLTDKHKCFAWGDNDYSQICQKNVFATVPNFVQPIPIEAENGKDYFFVKLYCSINQNSAIMEHYITHEQIYVKWGGTLASSLDLNNCIQKNITLPSNPINFYSNVDSNLIVQYNKQGQSKLYCSGLNSFYALGVSEKSIKEPQQVAIQQCIIIQAAIGTTNTSALVVI